MNAMKAVFVSVVFSFWACDEKKAVPAPAPAPVAAPAPAPAPVKGPESVEPPPGSTPTVPAHMKEHFTKALDLQRAVIAGNVPEFKAAAVWMAEHQLGDGQTYPPEWKDGVAAMQEAARQGRDATDLKSAAAAMGTMGVACAACHAKLGGPKAVLTEKPAEASGTVPHMKTHQWAADAMWTGLMAPSDDAWVKGAEAMSGAPLTHDTISPNKTVVKALAKLADESHALAGKARTAEASGRGAAYADFLVGCSACHQQLKK